MNIIISTRSIIGLVVIALLVTSGGLSTTASAASDIGHSGATCDYESAQKSKSLDGLKPCMESRYREEVATAVFFLGQMKDPRVPELLLKIWQGKKLEIYNTQPGYLNDYAVKLQAVRWLLIRNIGDKEDYSGFVQEQIRNPDPYVRAEAVKALGSIGDKESIRMLMNFVKYDYPTVSLNALIALINISNVGENRTTAIEALNSLYKEKEEILDPLTKLKLESLFRRDENNIERADRKKM